MPPKNQSDTEEHLKQVYGYYKKLDLWSLTKGLAILTIPSWIHPADPDPPKIFEHGPLSERCLDIEIFKMGLESGKLKSYGYDKKNVDNWKPVDNEHLNYDVQTDYWYSCFDKVTISPFDFLEFVKEKDLFEIPSELEWVRINDKYLWASEANGQGYDKTTDLDDFRTVSEDTELKWQGITATLLDDYEILFQFKDKAIKRNYNDLGFANQRNGSKTKAWDALVTASQIGGCLPYKNSDRSQIEKRAGEIRLRLKNLFPGVSGDPFPIVKEDGVYKLKLHLKNNKE